MAAVVRSTNADADPVMGSQSRLREATSGSRCYAWSGMDLGTTNGGVGNNAWMGSVGPWMGSLGLSMVFLFFIRFTVVGNEPPQKRSH